MIDIPFDNLLLVGQPFTVVVASPSDASTIVACGDIVNQVVNGQITIELAPVGGSGVVGVAVLDRDEQGFLGLGGDEVQVTAYVLTGLGGGQAAATPAVGTPGGATVTVDAEDIYFKPDLITLPANTPVTVIFTNQGQAVHNFSVTDHGNPGLANLSIDVTINPGQTKTFTINAPAGDYYFFCDQPGHEQAGMRGYLNVEEGAEISTSEVPGLTLTPRAG